MPRVSQVCSSGVVLPHQMKGMDELKCEENQRLESQVFTEVKHQGWIQRDPEGTVTITMGPGSSSLTGEIQERVVGVFRPHILMTFMTSELQ